MTGLTNRNEQQSFLSSFLHSLLLLPHTTMTDTNGRRLSTAIISESGFFLYQLPSSKSLCEDSCYVWLSVSKYYRFRLLPSPSGGLNNHLSLVSKGDGHPYETLPLQAPIFPSFSLSLTLHRRRTILIRYEVFIK